MSQVLVDQIGEHTTGAGIGTTAILYALGYMMQPDSLDISFTIPVGYTMYVQKAINVVGDNILTVQGTLVVQ